MCARFPALAAGSDPDLIAQLEHSYVVLADSVTWPGWCVLILKEHGEHLDMLEAARRAGIMGEVGRVGAALRAAGLGIRINYECLGNVVNHIHWHVIPRRVDEPEPRATVWTRPAPERDRGGTAQERETLVLRIRMQLEKLEDHSGPTTWSFGT
jgi:diadenosine tetraphosphate (Ap4A) HIT family hydrolase